MITARQSGGPPCRMDCHGRLEANMTSTGAQRAMMVNGPQCAEARFPSFLPPDGAFLCYADVYRADNGDSGIGA